MTGRVQIKTNHRGRTPGYEVHFDGKFYDRLHYEPRYGYTANVPVIDTGKPGESAVGTRVMVDRPLREFMDQAERSSAELERRGDPNR